MSIQNFELQLYSTFPAYWQTMLNNIGTGNDIIPNIFADLPSTGTYGANQAAISSLFQTMKLGNTSTDLSFILQYPTLKAHVPCVTIEVQDEVEDEAIGSFVAEMTDVSGNVIDYIGGPFTKRYSIGVWSWLPDTTLYLFSFVKYMLLDIRSNFQSAANMHISIRPMQIDGQRFAEPAYFRYIDITTDGIIDTVDRSYAAVTQVTIQDTEFINQINIDENAI